MSGFSLTGSLAGIGAASKRLEVSADNVARRNVENSSKNRVNQNSTENGGVEVTVQKIENTNTDDSGLTQYDSSNIDYAEEAIQQSIAALSFNASARIADEALDMTDQLVNMKV